MLNLFSVNSPNKLNLLNFNHFEMKEIFTSINEQSFRAEQIMKWIYHYSLNNFDKMTNINFNLRKKIKKLFTINVPEIVKENISLDGTIKWLMKTNNKKIETVYIPEKKRSTLCISSQSGCMLGCTFCYTGQQKSFKNLEVNEIIGQIFQAIKTIKEKNIVNKNKRIITNIVFMGMGEPLLNFKNVIKSINIMLDHYAFNFSRKHITLSTSGIVPGLKKLSEMTNISLAISLHASNDKIRSIIMPINKKYKISEVLDAAKNYVKKSNSKKFTIEYVLLKKINDNNKHAYELVSLLKNMPCKINLIPWNYFPKSSYQCSSNERIFIFSKILLENGFITTIRKNRGKDISAACGQLSTV